MEAEKQPGMILICLNVYIVAYAKSLVLLMLLYKDQILNLRQKLEELYYNKEKLLDNGDRWESVLAKNIKLDKPYR